MKLIIEEAEKGLAEETRRALKGLVQAAEALEVLPPIVLSKERIKELKATGAAYISEIPPATILGQGRAALALELRKLWHEQGFVDTAEYCEENLVKSYVLEGAANAVSRRLFMEFKGADNALDEWVDIIRAPLGSSYEVDHRVEDYVGAGALSGNPEEYLDKLRDELPMGYRVFSGIASPEQSWAILYPQDGEPWIAGITGIRDPRTVKFFRKRLGAHLAEHHSPAAVREVVEEYKTLLADGEFRLFPNDIAWGKVYTGVCKVPSCMSYPESAYASAVHPINAYSSAYYDCGDNGLALVVGRDGRSRGILNTRNMQVVRWYGRHADSCPLRRLGIGVNSAALAGSWLALIEEAHDFVAPYVDGDYSHGTIEGGRVLLQDGNDGDTELEYTGGLYPNPAVSRVQCEYSDAYYAEDDCVWCDGGEYWVAEEYSSNVETCGVSGKSWLRSELYEVVLDDQFRWVHETELAESCWLCGDGVRWFSNSTLSVLDVNGDLWPEEDCRQLRSGEWVLTEEYEEEEDELEENDEAA